MMRSALIFTCALAAAACGGADASKTAQDPSTTSTTSATNPSTSTQPTTTSPSDTTASSSPAMNGTGDTSALPANGTAPATMGTSANTGSQTGSSSGSSSGMQNTASGSGSSALAPATQGTSKSETDITAAIHKAVKSTKGLSPSAKNVKVITMGTKVTLTGAVSSDSEKSSIESLAQNAAGVTAVDDQLQVITK